MEDGNSLLILSALTYLLICFIVASIAESRGYKLSGSFFVAIIITPLIAAILFSNNKKIQEETLEEIKRLNQNKPTT